MPSIFDNVLNKLFPAREEVYGGLLGPEDIADQRRQALSRVGQSLLATGGPRPTGTRNFGQNLGEALQSANWPGALDEAAQHAAAFREIAQKGAGQRALQAIVAKYPAVEGETPEQAMDRFEQMIPDLIQAGLTEQATKLQELVIRSRPKADAYTTVSPGQQIVNPATGKVVYVAPAKPTPSEAFDQGTKLRGEFTDQSAELRNVANGYRTLKAFTSEPKRTGTTDQGVVFSYMKMLDPRSTLQNGQRAEEGTLKGVPGEIVGLYNLLLDNPKARLSDAQYKDILAAAEALLQTRGAEFTRLYERYHQLSTDLGLEPGHVINDYFAGLKIPRATADSKALDDLLKKEPQ